MKNLLNSFLLLSFSLLFFACDKGETSEPLPDTFEKRVLLEKITATWCSACGSAADRVANIVATNPDNIIVAAYHKGDQFDPHANPSLPQMYSVSGQPAALLDRHVFDQFGINSVQLGVSSFLSQLAEMRFDEGTDLGVKIGSSLSGQEITLDVEVASLVDVEETLFLHVYLIENGVAGPQVGQNDPDFKHDYVVREVITDPLGEPISLASAREVSLKSFTATLDDNNESSNMQVIAFVTHKDEDDQNKDVRNVQVVDLGGSSSW